MGTENKLASEQVRRDARSYVADLRKARLARAGGHQGPGVSQEALNDAPETSNERQSEGITAQAGPVVSQQRPKIGKRGVRVRKNDVSAAVATEHKKQLQESARIKAKDTAREATKNARAAAQEVKKNIHAARMKQREAAAKQREAVTAMRQKQAARRWVPTRNGGATLHVNASAAMQSKIETKPAHKTPGVKPIALTSIKGIGEAMERRLEQAGIASVKDLTALSPDSIRERLGPVSALANVEAWQEQASALLSSENTR